MHLYIAVIVLLILGFIFLIWGLFSLFFIRNPRNPSKVPGLLITIGVVLLFIALTITVLEYDIPTPMFIVS